MDRSRVTVAEIFRPRGIRGELIARSLTDVSGRLESLKSAFVRLPDGTDQAVEVTAVWRHKDDWVVKFAGVDSIDAADVFRGADLWVPVSERAALPDGEYFQSDLMGCQVVDGGSGRVIGIVEGWQQFGGPPLIEVTFEGKEVLLPFVASECRIDLGARVIRMNLAEGLLDL
jgi:16S rRNA processing protein RimM